MNIPAKDNQIFPCIHAFVLEAPSNNVLCASLLDIQRLHIRIEQYLHKL